MKLNLFVFYEELKKMIAEIDDIDSWEEKLPSCPNMKISINNRNVVTSVASYLSFDITINC